MSAAGPEQKVLLSGIVNVLPDEFRQMDVISSMYVYPESVTRTDDGMVFLGRRRTEKILVVIASEEHPVFSGCLVKEALNGGSKFVSLHRADHPNAEILRRQVPWTAPRVAGLKRSVGCGDRLGLATPGHLRSVRKHDFFPILAQQSIREMTRTSRSPQEVLDAATWGVFQEGWSSGFGADADHLKTTDDIDRCLDAGFTFFTIDPSAFVDNDADTDSPSAIRQKVERLPWDSLLATLPDLRGTYTGRPADLGSITIRLSEEDFMRALVKYGAAIAHTAGMYRYLCGRMNGRPFELEMSVDETETPTSVEEHFFVASELKRLEVEWASLAPRFTGRLEKGVDYIGDLERFQEELVRHVAIARSIGPYKLSLHSGSDKFSLYPYFAREAGDLFHLKTAGTSYLEALRAVARIDPDQFQELLDFAVDRYETDRATYHVSARVDRVVERLSTAPVNMDLLDDFDTRQVLHVTFGSVLTASRDDGSSLFSDRIKQALQADEEIHYAALEAHFDRHLEPFDR